MPRNNEKLSRAALAAFVFASVFFIISCANARPQTTAKTNYQLAADYSKESRGLAVLIYENNKLVFEEYQNGHSADRAHRLASGTKSFSGVMLAAAIEDGLVRNFDEKISETITEWKNDEQKAKITLRQLLSLTSGLDAGQNGQPPAYAEAINFPAEHEAGSTFQYGPVPFQIFGAVMKRKLAPKKETVMDYLKRRILDPIGIRVGYWRSQNGDPSLPSGAYLTAREWAKFGQFLLDKGRWNGKQIVKKDLLEELTKGSDTNPNYGITFWLNRSLRGRSVFAVNGNGRGQRLRRLLNTGSERRGKGFVKGLPDDVFVAAGAANQRLYIIPSKNMVIVRQGLQTRFNDTEFLSLLLYGKS